MMTPRGTGVLVANGAALNRRWLDLTRAIEDATRAIVRDKQATVAKALANGSARATRPAPTRSPGRSSSSPSIPRSRTTPLLDARVKESFRTARWSTLEPTVYEYNPFRAGPRMGIGAAFATMEIKFALAMTLPRFHVERLPGTRVDHRVAIRMAPRDGMRIRKAEHGRAAARRGLPPVRRLVEVGS